MDVSKKITITIDGKEYTEEEAKELLDKLKNVFPKQELSPVFIPVPYQVPVPTYIPYPEKHWWFQNPPYKIGDFFPYDTHTTCYSKPYEYMGVVCGL